MQWTFKGRVLTRVLRRGSKKGTFKKGLSRRHLEGRRNSPFQEYDPVRVRPSSSFVDHGIERLRKPVNLNCRLRSGPLKKELCFTVEFKNDYVLAFIICEIPTVITLQDWVGWGIFTVIPGIHGESGDSQLIRGMLRITGWAPVRIIYRKKLQDRALFEITK